MEDNKKVSGEATHEPLVEDLTSRHGWSSTITTKYRKPEDKPTLSPCIKCGGTDISTSYHGSHMNCSPEWRKEHYSPSDLNQMEHLHYYCRVCGYSWVGPTKDSE